MIRSCAMHLIGNTPVVDLSSLSPNPRVRVLVKLEGQNPFGSFKDRVAKSMLEEARRNGSLSPGQRIVAPSSGNTGISFAGLGGMAGHPVTITMPASASRERRYTLEFLGADVVPTPAELGTGGAIGKARELAEKNPHWCLLDQYSCDSNARAHFETTAPEILRDAPEITHFVAGIGSGGTLVGVGRFLKERNSSVALVAVEPEHGHPIEGVRNMIGGHEPALFLKWSGHELIDSILHIRHADSLGMTKKLARECGIFAGPSSGMALAAALAIAARIDRGTILFLACDGGWKYLAGSTVKPSNTTAPLQTE
jgi:cysteine synthase